MLYQPATDGVEVGMAAGACINVLITFCRVLEGAVMRCARTG